eukprot:g66722.t1
MWLPATPETPDRTVKSAPKYRKTYMVRHNAKGVKICVSKFHSLRQLVIMSAPEWQNADSCKKCAAKFTMVNRKHHCRNCGHTFCGKDTTKRCPVLEFGYTEPQRVCDTCYDMIQAGSSSSKSSRTSAKPRNEPSGAKQASASSPSQPAPEPAAKPKKVKQCVCNMPLCICPNPSEENEPQARPEPSKAEQPKKQSKASTNYSQAAVGSFSGFGRPEKRSYDLSGNLNEQCREAVKAGDLEGVKQLLSAGASARYEDRTGNTLLHLAAMFNRLDLVQVLVEAGGDLTRKNPDKETPADLAPPSLQIKIKSMMSG